MLKQIAWNTFKTTGNINTMLELLEVDKTINNIRGTEKIETVETILEHQNKEMKEEKWEL